MIRRAALLVLCCLPLARGEQVEFLPEAVDVLAAVWHPDGRCAEAGLTRRSQGRGVSLDVPPGAAWGGFPMVRLTAEFVAELRRAGATAVGLIDPRPEQLELLRGFPELEVLHLRNTRRLHDADLEILTALPHLRQLQLESARHLTQAALTTLAKLPALTFLELSGAPQLEGAPLERLAGSGLRDLDLSHCVAVTSLAGGSRLPLRGLRLDGCLGLGPKGARGLRALEQLERLSLRGCILDDAALAALPASLRELDLGETAVRPLALASLLERTPALEILRLPACPLLTAALTPALAGRTALRELDLREATWLDAAQLEQLATLPALARLDLGGAALPGADLAKLASAPALRELSLNDCSALGAATGPALASCTALERLGLAGTRLDDAAFAQLAALTGLRDLDLSRSPRLTDAALEALADLPLERLDLSGCPGLSAAGLEHLRAMTTLRQLDLVGSPVRGADVERLREALSDCRIRSLE